MCGISARWQHKFLEAAPAEKSACRTWAGETGPANVALYWTIMGAVTRQQTHTHSRQTGSSSIPCAMYLYTQNAVAFCLLGNIALGSLFTLCVQFQNDVISK